MKTKNAQQPKEASPKINPSFLLGKVGQSDSVRSTFTLTPEADRILDTLSERASITQREVFDQARLESLKILAQKIHDNFKSEERSERRTLVISDRALKMLDQVSKDSGIRRDDLACEMIKAFAKSYAERVSSSRAASKKIIDAVWKEVWEHLDDLPPERKKRISSVAGDVFADEALFLAKHLLFIAGDSLEQCNKDNECNEPGLYRAKERLFGDGNDTEFDSNTLWGLFQIAKLPSLDTEEVIDED